MASELDSLDFKIGANIANAMDSIKNLGANIDKVFTSVERVDVALRNLGQAAGLPAAQVELLTLRIQPLVNKLTEAKRKANALEESFTRKLMARAMEDHNRKVVKLADGTERARYQMIRLADASQQLRIPTQGPRAPAQQQQASSGVNFVRITTAAAQMGMLARVSATMASVAKSVTNVGEVSKITATSLDRFRLGLHAPMVNPEMNVVKQGIDKVGDAAANGINKVREIADAVASDIPGTIGAGVSALGKINVELDKASATASKHVSQMQSSSKGLTLLGRVFPFLRSQIQSVQEPFDTLRMKAEAGANKLDQMNATVSASADKLRNARFVLDGTFQSLGGSADMFARAAFHANLPIRLLKREWEGATRVVRAATHVWNFATKPIHAVTLAIGHSSAQFKVFRSQLPPLTGGLQLGTRVFRAFAHATYMTGPAATLATKAVTGLARGVWSMISPAKSAATSLLKLTGIQNAFIGKSIGMTKAGNDAAATLAKLDAASARASKGIGSFNSKAGMMKTAAAGLIAGMVALGTSTAVATEKNNAVFGVMMKDVSQGAAVVKSLQGTKAAKLFDNQELLDSGRLLFKAGVSAKDLAGKTEQLATIAVATSTELGDLTRIYQQGANVGSFGLDKINQLAERGIDIYHALTAATGASGAELSKMISDGKIGITQMDAALAHLTEGHGIYAGSLETLAATTDGRFKSMKNNVSQALGQVMNVALQVLAPFGTALVMMTDGFSAAFNGMREPIIYAATAAAWAFGNIGNLGKFAFLTVRLFAVSAFNDLQHFLTTKIPAYLIWFKDNWKTVFTDILNGTKAIFNNMTSNIKNAMNGIWNFIKSGGMMKLEFAWTPLLDGFKSTISEIPEIPDRAMSELEKKLTLQTQEIGSGLADNFEAMLKEAQAKVGEAPTVLSNAKSNQAGSGDGASAASSAARKAAENRAIGVRSAEGQSVVAQMMRAMEKKNTGKERQAQDAQIRASEDLRRIEQHLRKQPQIVTGKW